METMRFADRDAAIIGMSDIGKAVAARLSEEGARVLLVDDNRDVLEATAQRLRTAGATVSTECIDMADLEAAAPLAARHADEGWHIDVLVNSPMTSAWASIEHVALPDWERTIRVNLTGALAWSQAFLPQLKTTGRGAIVHMGTVDGLFGNPRVPAYSASKGGLIPLTHVMAHDLAKYPVRVNLVCRLASTESTIPDTAIERTYYDQLREATALKRFGRPEETAAAIAFLASEEASYITGATLVVDGGRTILTNGTARVPGME